MPTRSAIEQLLAGRRLAVVGVWRDERRFANGVYRALRANGRVLHPVNAAITAGMHLEGDVGDASLLRALVRRPVAV